MPMDYGNTTAKKSYRLVAFSYTVEKRKLLLVRFCRNVKMRCLWQRAIPLTIVMTIKRKEAVPYAQ